MKLCKLIIVIVILSAPAFSYPFDSVRAAGREDAGPLFVLSHEERSRLNEHGTPRIGVWVNVPPYAFLNQAGKPQGIFVDYVEALEKKLETKFKIVAVPSFADAWSKAMNKELDLLVAVTPSDRHLKYMNLSQTYHVVPVILVTRTDMPLVSSIKAFNGKKVVVGKGHVTEQWIKRDFPAIRLIPSDDYETGLRLVSEGGADAYAGAMAALTWQIKKHRITNLKIAAGTPYEYRVSIAVRKDWPGFIPIINKALQSIEDETRDSIYDKWVAVRHEERVDWNYFWKVAGGVAVLFMAAISIILIWNRSLRKEIDAKEKAEKALIESERQLSTLIGNLPGIAYRCLYDANWTMLYLSDGCETLTGYKPSELIDNRVKAFNELIIAGDRNKINAEVRNAVDSSSPFTIEYRIIAKDGTEKWVWEKGVALREKDTGTIFFEGFINDISDRKEVEKRLVKKEETLRGIFNAMPSGVVLVDFSGEVIFSNHRMAEMFACSQEDLVGSLYLDYTNGSETPEAEKKMFQLIRGEIEFVSLERLYRRKDGTTFIGHLSGRRLNHSDGTFWALVGVITDITERKKAQSALVESEARYRALFDFNPIQTIVVDIEGRIVMYNFAKERSDGRIPSTGDMMYQDYAARHEIDMHRELLECIRTGATKSYSEMKYKDRFLNIRIASFSGGAIITSEDITEKKRLQGLLEQARRMEAIGTLSGGVAHEFNNILGIILGHAELAMDDIPKYVPAYEFLMEVKNAAIRGKDIVRQLLSYSHDYDHRKHPLDLADVVRESLPLLKTTTPATIGFDVALAGDGRTVMGDKNQIHQLLINLCGNAAQSMEETGGTLKIVLENHVATKPRVFFGRQLEPGEYVRLTIADVGTGIPADIMENIFDPFFTTKTVDKGSGMGLAMVYGIIKGHGGFIELESNPRNGTRVYCYFPVVETDPAAVHKPQGLPEGKKTILFVDDEAALAKMGKKQLERLGYEVEATTDPSEALLKFRKSPEKYDLVITDMTMAPMTGDRLIKELVKIRPDIRTIICTGYSGRMDEREAARIGASGFIMKPVDREKLAEAIRRAFNG